jgi:hypothetical protein
LHKAYQSRKANESKGLSRIGNSVVKKFYDLRKNDEVNSDFKNWLIAAVGTTTSFAMANINAVLSGLAALATFIFGCCKIYDWAEARIQKRNEKGKEI